MIMRVTKLNLCTVALILAALPTAPGKTETPRSHDPRIQVDLFAASPDIMQPIGAAFDHKGRLLVIESHTHFRPKGYKGPAHDRVRILEDTDGDGKADRFTTFYEGTDATMGIAVHPDGSVYLATRNEVLRLRDTKGSGKADECRRILFLDTKGNYPHNGLSGLAFDARGNLYVGMGENLGADYKLIGSDGATLTGGGEGGNVFWCTADGRGLRRLATGFWNPFGICTDIFGRVFAVDNDPDEMPPCRLVQVVEGGDYGFQYRYGRSGRHPFQSWDGQLPGTLPMAAGVGEAPCQVLSYESDGLPAEYRGDLLVASWADHRIERYVLKERGASVAAERRPFIQGGSDFRPVGIALAPDGSLFVTDWVKSNYELHGKGAVWHIHLRQPGKVNRPADPRRALASAHRPLREAAAGKLAKDEKGRQFLRRQLASSDVRVRAASLTALINAEELKLDLATIAAHEPVAPLRALAVRVLVDRDGDARRFLDAGNSPAVQFEAIRSLKRKADLPRLLKLLTDPDPFLRHAAVQRLAHSVELLATVDGSSVLPPGEGGAAWGGKVALTDPRQRVGLLLAWRASGRPEGVRHVRDFLADPDEDVRFLAAKWIADQKLVAYRPAVSVALKDSKLSVRLFFAYSAALARLDGHDGSEAQMAGYFFDRLRDAKGPPALRVLALQMIPPSYAKLTPELLAGLLKEPNLALRLEAARALTDSPSPARLPILRQAAQDAALGDAVRAQAILGLAERSQDVLDDLFSFVQGNNAVLRNEALRALVGTKLSQQQRAVLEKVAHDWPASAALAARALGRPFIKDRPPAAHLDAWLKRLEGPADADAGRRIFFHPKLVGCFRCHRVEGRGQKLGPDLSSIGRAGRRHIVESILQPSAVVAPHYQTWQVETTDGKVRTGMLVRTVLDDYTYLDAKGNFFHVRTGDVVEARPVSQSIMPDGLADLLTDQELRDLAAYLEARR
jgi:putative membrane-bound dehydrogenase-like protein